MLINKVTDSVSKLGAVVVDATLVTSHSWCILVGRRHVEVYVERRKPEGSVCDDTVGNDGDEDEDGDDDEDDAGQQRLDCRKESVSASSKEESERERWEVSEFTCLP